MGEKGKAEGGGRGGVLIKFRGRCDVARLKAIESRFGFRYGNRVPEGVKEAITEVTDLKKLSALLRASIRCADLESFAREL